MVVASDEASSKMFDTFCLTDTNNKSYNSYNAVYIVPMQTVHPKWRTFTYYGITPHQ